VIENGSPIATAMSLLKECDLKLEDILPYFPDFVRIGDFKVVSFTSTPLRRPFVGFNFVDDWGIG
jgi:hypothetical protein